MCVSFHVPQELSWKTYWCEIGRALEIWGPNIMRGIFCIVLRPALARIRSFNRWQTHNNNNSEQYRKVIVPYSYEVDTCHYSILKRTQSTPEACRFSRLADAYAMRQLPAGRVGDNAAECEERASYFYAHAYLWYRPRWADNVMVMCARARVCVRHANQSHVLYSGAPNRTAFVHFVGSFERSTPLVWLCLNSFGMPCDLDLFI